MQSQICTAVSTILC